MNSIMSRGWVRWAMKNSPLPLEDVVQRLGDRERPERQQVGCRQRDLADAARHDGGLGRPGCVVRVDHYG